MSPVIPFFTAHLLILAIWAWLWAVCFGWGGLALVALRCTRDDALTCIVRPLVGFAAVIAALQLWHLVLPVNIWAFGLLSAIGLLGAALLSRPWLASGWAAIRAHRIPALMAAAWVVWLANRALNSQHYHDHGLYYMNAIRWATDYPIVLGLGNLHDRLAFNNSSFLLHAMLELGSWRGYSGHFVNGFIGAMVVPIVVHGVWSLAYGDARARQLGCFLVALGFLLADGASDRRISSASTDFPAALLVTVAAWRLLAVGLLQEERGGRNLSWNVAVFAVLTAAAVTIKTIVIFFVTFSWIAVALYVIWRARRQSGREKQGTGVVDSPISVWRPASIMVTCGAVLVLPWIARGYALSGSPLFPSTIGRIDFDWAMTTEAARIQREGIVAFARSSHLDREVGYQPGWGWIDEWLWQVVIVRAPLELVAPAMISLLCTVWLIVNRRRGAPMDDLTRASAPTDSRLIPRILISVYLLSLVCWFFTAPAGRMGSFAMWGLAGICLGLISRTTSFAYVERYPKLVLAATIGLLLLPTLHKAALIELRYRKNPNMPELGKRFYHFQPLVMPVGDDGFPPVPQGKLTQRTTDSGLVVNFGVLQEDGKPGLVWDSPLPTGRFFNPRLALRKPADLKYGFTVAPVGRDRHSTEPSTTTVGTD
jgi:hypothetical protein